MDNVTASSHKIVLLPRYQTKNKHNIHMLRKMLMLTSLKIVRTMKMITMRIDQRPSSLAIANQFITQVCSRKDLDKNKNSLNLKLMK